jgi:hypothetical protein
MTWRVRVDPVAVLAQACLVCHQAAEAVVTFRHGMFIKLPLCGRHALSLWGQLEFVAFPDAPRPDPEETDE